MTFTLSPPKMKKWSMPSRSRVGEFRIFQVDRSTVRDGQGAARPDVFTIECRDWCNVIAVTDDDHVVFVWQYRFGTDELSLEIPGGVIDPGESPIFAAGRELLEETGYAAAGALEPLLAIAPNPAIQNNRCHTFVARGARSVGETKFDELEELELALIPVGHLPQLLDGGHVSHALVHSALEAFMRRSARRS